MKLLYILALALIPPIPLLPPPPPVLAAVCVSPAQRPSGQPHVSIVSCPPEKGVKQKGKNKGKHQPNRSSALHSTPGVTL